jgi:hypothetical protein
MHHTTFVIIICEIIQIINSNFFYKNSMDEMKDVVITQRICINV